MARIPGLTNERTKNLLVLSTGQEANVRCGADILLTGMYQDVKGEAVCPVCGTKTEIVIKGRRVISANPGTALLHYVVESKSMFSICCSYTFVFDREGCLKSWLATYEGKPGAISSLPAFMQKAIKRRGSGRQGRRWSPSERSSAHHPPTF